VDSPVQITDWMPTLTALAGYKPSADLGWDGINIGPLLLEHQPLAERPLYAVAPGWRSRSLRLGDWKLIVSGQGETDVELFNLKNDPAEAKNLASEVPEVAAKLRARLDEAAARDREAAVGR
jgi:arylsulfatase A-like enzyme